MKKPTATGELLRQLVAQKAPTPEGFALADAKHLATQTTPKYCSQQVALGLLFKGKVGHSLIRYFSTAHAARQFEIDNKKPVLIAPSKPVKCMQDKAPAGPCKATEPIHTANTRYSSRPWVDPRAVSVPYRRIGQPGFSMSI